MFHDHDVPRAHGQISACCSKTCIIFQFCKLLESWAILNRMSPGSLAQVS